MRSILPRCLFLLACQAAHYVDCGTLTDARAAAFTARPLSALPRPRRDGIFAVRTVPEVAADVTSTYDIGPIGVGTLAWGDPKRGFVAEGAVSAEPSSESRPFGPDDVEMSGSMLVDAGITFFDTAEVYGYQNIPNGYQSEQLLGKLGKKRPSVRVATKFFPLLWTNALGVGGGFRWGSEAVSRAIDNSLARLDGVPIALFQLHFPFPYIGGYPALAEGLAKARLDGKCQHIGVSNFDIKELPQMERELSKWNTPTVSNQIPLSLIDQRYLVDGSLEYCFERGITPIAHSPLAQGKLTTRAVEASTADASPRGKDGGRLSRIQAALQRLTPQINARVVEERQRSASAGGASAASPVDWLVGAFQTATADERRGEGAGGANDGSIVTPTQVALNWCRSKGAAPIPGVKNVQQAKEVIVCSSWSLTEDEVAELDEASRSG